MTRSRTELLALGALLAMTAAWGSTFFLIKDLVRRTGVADMLALRFAVASVALALLAGRRLRLTRSVLRRGLALGLLYGVAQILQTVGLSLTAASVSGFITGLYVVLTPLLGGLLLRARVGATTWLATGLATLGLGVLSLQGWSVGAGEVLTFASAVVYALHILVMSRYSEPGDALGLSLVQLVVITVVCALAALWPDADGTVGITLPGSTADWLSLLYLAVVAGALTMVLQTWAQARLDPSRAAVVMAMEPVWAAAFAVALGGERLTARMVLGGLAIVAAMYLVELAPRRSPSEPVAEQSALPKSVP